jgi:hypothetical protein
MQITITNIHSAYLGEGLSDKAMTGGRLLIIYIVFYRAISLNEVEL